MATVSTARRHFDEDIARATALLTQGIVTLPTDVALGGDLMRHSVASAVGAMDAYLCDAYVDLLVSSARAVRDKKMTSLPAGFAKERLPIGPLLSQRYPQRPNWGLRMAAREIMEKDNMLQISRIEGMFNPALPVGHRLWGDLIGTYAALNRKRLTLWKATELTTGNTQRRAKRRKEATAALKKRIGSIVQRRHDIVHNCDRPKVALQSLTLGQARGMVADVHDFVRILDQHVLAHRVA